MKRPKLAARFAGLLLAPGTADDWHREAGVTLCLAAAASGEPPPSHALAAVIDAINMGGKHAEYVAKLLRQSFDSPTEVNKVLSALLDVWEPATAGQVERWFSVLPVSLHRAAPPQVVLQVLRSVSAAGLSPSVLQSLHALTGPLLGSDKYETEMHRLWLTVISEHPAHLIEYIRICLEANPPHTEWVETAFDHLLETGDAAYIRDFLGWAGGKPVEVDPLRLAQAVSFYQIMSDAAQQMGGRISIASRSDFVTLRRTVLSKFTVDHADMLVAAVQVIREHLNPHWLTPVEFEAEALCDAQRLDEAVALDEQHLAIKVGPKREPLDVRIERLRQLGISRSSVPQSSDYARIMRTCFVPPRR